MIGAGVFALSGEIVLKANIFSILVLILAGTISLSTGIVYGIFSKYVISSGGGYSYVNSVYPNLLGFLTGWLFFLAYSFAGAFYVGVFGRYLEIITGVPFIIYGIALVVAFNTINFFGIKESSVVESIFTSVKVSIIIFFILLGLSNFNLKIFEAKACSVATPSVLTIIVLSATIFIAFEGFDIISTLSQEMKDPNRDVIRSIIASIVIVTTIYILVATVELLALESGAIPANVSPEEVILYAAYNYLKSFGYYLIVIGAIISTVSAYNATLVAVSRLIFSMSSDSYLPKFLNFVHEESGTPRMAIITSSILISSIITMQYFITDPERISVFLGQLASFAFALAFTIVNLAFLKVEKVTGGEKLAMYKIFAIYAIIFTSILCIILVIENILSATITMVLIFVGVMLYSKKTRNNVYSGG